MNVIDRKLKILDELKTNGSVSITDLASFFGVSSMTIRRDLMKLSEQGLITLERGGAILNTGSLFEYDVPLKQKEKMPEKKRIAEKCMEYIKEGDSLFLDAGTTVAEIARLLRKEKNITVITNSLLSANCLCAASDLKIIMCPGEYRETSMAYIGPMTSEFISQFKIDTLFLGIEGINPENGLTVPDPLDGMTKRALIQNAKKVICVADSSKIGLSYLYQIAPLTSADIFITDKGINQYDAEAFIRNNISLIVV